jgi:hypothetical protein
MRANDLISFLSILLEKHDVSPCRGAKVTGVVVGISRPREAVVRNLVPFFTRDLAGFAADANTRISKKSHFDAIVNIGVLSLVRALDSFADHRSLGVMEQRRRDVRVFLITPLLRLGSS